VTGKRGLLDTNIIIYLSKKELSLSSIFDRYDELSISRISYMEVLGYAKASAEELSELYTLLELFTIYDTNQKISNITVEIRKTYTLKLPDAIILATAKCYDCELVTANTKDFKNGMGGVNIFNPTKGIS